MQQILIVGLGGFLGSIGRFLLSSLIVEMTAPNRFPLSTFAVNILGCLVIGLLAGLAERQPAFGPDARLFLFTGLLGGFTTFSAFGLETTDLIRRGELGFAALYSGGSVALGITAIWLGFKLVAMLAR